MHLRTLLASAIAFACAPLAPASDWYFTGVAGTGWYDEIYVGTDPGGHAIYTNNWGITGVRPLAYPGSSDNVFFSSVGTASLNYATAGVADVSVTGSTLRVENGAVLTVHGASLFNNGTVTIAYGGFAGNGQIAAAGPLSLSGTGQLLFSGGSLTGGTITQSADHLIHGSSGYIDTALVNHGIVHADVSGGWLQVRGAVTNQGTLKASNTARLELRNDVIQSGSGVIHSDGGTVYLVNNTVTGGTLRSNSGYDIEVAGGATGTIGDLTIDGTVRARNVNTRLILSGSNITNNGRIISTESTGMGAGQIRVDSNLALGGSGELWVRTKLYSDNGSTLTNLHGHLIRYGDDSSGTGQIDVALVNEGIVRSDFNGRSISLGNVPKTNKNIIEAINGGTLSLASSITQTTNASIRATGGNVYLASASITGGSLLGSSGFEFQTSGGTTSTLTNLTNQALIRINNNNSKLALAGSTLVNDGTIILTANTGMGAGQMRVDSDVTLDGTGEIWCRTLLFSDSTNTLTNGLNHTIRYGDESSGEGQIDVALVNDGVVRADFGGRGIALTTNPKTNNHLMEATNGGILELRCPITQSHTAVVAANGGTVRLNGVQLVGGEVTGTSGWFIDSTGGSSNIFDNLTNTGYVRMLNHGTVLTVRGTITNHGTIELYPNTGMGAGRIKIDQPGVQFQGTGELLARSEIFSDVGLGFLNGPGHTLAGNGNIKVPVTNQGIIAPRSSTSPVSSLTISSSLECGPTAVLQTHLASGGFDYLAVSGNASIDGDLLIELVGSFLPTRTATFRVLSAANLTGDFNNVGPFGFIPTVGNLSGFVPEYSSTKLVLKNFTRVGDVNLDNLVDNQDIASLVELLTGGMVPSDELGFAADCNHDGVVNNQDIAPFVALLTGPGMPAGDDPDFAPLMALVHEPTTLALLALALLPASRRRR